MIPGCSVGDFIGAYFNTFYNAQRQFEEAEGELLAQPDTRQKELPFGFAYNVQAGTKTKFAGVIEKCSKLLQYHSKSKLVDDALLMIGKSYYYQNDYQPAERKFKELIEQFPTSDLAYDAKILLGYAYYTMGEKTKSSAAAKDLLEYAVQEDEDDYVAKASVLLAQLEIDNKNIDLAITYYQTAAEKGGTSEERCASYLYLAGLLTQVGKYQRALDAYRKAESASTTYQAGYKARIGQARMMSKLGAHEESLSLLEELLANSNYRDYYGEINLEIGNTYKESGDFNSAVAQYTYVDTAYAHTEVAANSYFQLGDIYETKLFQLDSAHLRYVRGKTEYPQAAITTQLGQRADNLTKYIQFRNEIRWLDSIRVVWLSPRDTILPHEPAPADSALGSHPGLADSATASASKLPTLPDSSGQDSDSTLAHAAQPKLGSPDSLGGKPDTIRTRIPVLPSISLDSANVRLALVEAELATLFYTSMSLPDSAERWYWHLLREHASSAQVPRALFTLAQLYSLDSTRSKATSDSLYNEVATRYPETEFGAEAIRILGRPMRPVFTDPADAAYFHAERLLEAGQAEAARDSLRAIVANYPSSPMASKAQYALGWTYEQRDDARSDSAASSYRKLVSLFPSSQYAALVKPKVDEYDLHIKALEQHVKDSLSAAARDTIPSVVKDSVQVKTGELEGKDGSPVEEKKPDDSSATEKKD
jgi:TolA-binding protein